ncbi:MAG TPA: hypothetical protein VGC80_00600 [Acetobacteraceae bacterium]|jgi:hypothetical protein
MTPLYSPDLAVALHPVRTTRVFLAAAHLDLNPTNNRPRNLKALCQRCPLLLDRPHHRGQARITILLRRAGGDLFLDAYARTRPAAWRGCSGRKAKGRLMRRPEFREAVGRHARRPRRWPL